MREGEEARAEAGAGAGAPNGRGSHMTFPVEARRCLGTQLRK